MLSSLLLVQAERLFCMGDDKGQDAFDGAVELLLKISPKRGSLVTLDHLWKQGDTHLQQLASLARTWNDSQEEPEPLKSTLGFCNLVADASWYCLASHIS